MTQAPLDSPTVIEEILAGDGLSLSAAARSIPAHRGKGHVQTTTIWRWVIKGVDVPGVGKVRLEAARIGCRWMTARAALKRFFAALTSAEVPTSTPPRSPAKRRRAIAIAEKNLAAAGV